MNKKTGFFAYPNTPTSCGISIEKAIETLNVDIPEISIKSWKKLEISGHLIISKILTEIERSDFFCADITHLNDNVLFELGFAIGKRKPVYIIQDTSISAGLTKFNELTFLKSVGYGIYTNSNDIINDFKDEAPYKTTTLLIDDFMVGVEPISEKFALLYLKSQIDTEFSRHITETIKYHKLPCIIDDANETKIQSLSWYISRLLTVPAVLVEFSATTRAGSTLQNTKCAFLAGLALGLGLKVQMIAEEPYYTPLDYLEYLKSYANLESCKSAILPFLAYLKNNIAELITYSKVVNNSQRVESSLQKIRFGEYIAEHESTNLYDYYINTAHEENILKSEYNIVVGRKGSGKTATLYYLQNALSKDPRNIVITIKPVNFEIEGLIELLKKLNPEFQTGYIIQSIWKFLIYTEVAKSIYELIKEKPLYALTHIDNQIIEFVEENKQILLTDFSTRLEQELINLEILSQINEQTEFKIKISEILHDTIIGKLKELVISFMAKKNKLVVLIDNLDKNWHKDKEISLVSKFILGLLSVIGRIARELKGNPKNPNPFNMNLVVFLRSDIFKKIYSNSREPDKLEYTRLKWNDPEVLFRLVNTRIETLSDKKYNLPTNFWEKYICSDYKDVPIQDYIISCIIPRPRDLIFFLNSAKNISVSRGHSKINEDDIQHAYSEYSEWIFQSILVENGITITQIEIFLYNVMGENAILDLAKITSFMESANISTTEENTAYFINFLCNISFLGREIKQDEFEFEYDFENDTKLQILAKKLNSNRYRVHNAFIPYLGCVI